MLIALGALSPDDVAQHVCLGKLGLDGSIAPVAGVLPAAMFCFLNCRGSTSARISQPGGPCLIAPNENLKSSSTTWNRLAA
jgi:magnesium chelatase family protein